MKYFPKSDYEIGNYILVNRKFAFLPKRVKDGYVFWKKYYEVVRTNKYYPQPNIGLDDYIYLSESEYLIFKLIYVSE